MFKRKTPPVTLRDESKGEVLSSKIRGSSFLTTPVPSGVDSQGKSLKESTSL